MDQDDNASNDKKVYDDPAYIGANDGWAQSAKRPHATPSIICKMENKPKLSYEDIPILTKNSDRCFL
jgi:hypothetical protein